MDVTTCEIGANLTLHNPLPFFGTYEPFSRASYAQENGLPLKTVGQGLTFFKNPPFVERLRWPVFEWHKPDPTQPAFYTKNVRHPQISG